MRGWAEMQSTPCSPTQAAPATVSHEGGPVPSGPAEAPRGPMRNHEPSWVERGIGRTTERPAR